MLRGVRVVEGADLERLCGVTHRGFESLPLSHEIYNSLFPLIYTSTHTILHSLFNQLPIAFLQTLYYNTK